VKVGSRPPRSCLIFSYSSGVRPCCRRVSGEKAEVKEVAMKVFVLSHFAELFYTFNPNRISRGLLRGGFAVALGGSYFSDFSIIRARILPIRTSAELQNRPFATKYVGIPP